ncbi:hypothetical protein TUM17567_17770 [Citrobacter amalonaticus]|nr:hypothetical protein TUM17567_17770 [Citrobacter amalonaticus]
MTTSKEKNVFYVHYYESDSSGGELPLMRIEAENEDEANLILTCSPLISTPRC